jgi:hypothetical protein
MNLPTGGRLDRQWQLIGGAAKRSRQPLRPRFQQSSGNAEVLGKNQQRTIQILIEAAANPRFVERLGLAELVDLRPRW